MTLIDYLWTLTVICAVWIGTYRIVAIVDAATRLALALRGISDPHSAAAPIEAGRG